MSEENISNNNMTEARWLELYNEWKSSGQSQSSFCQQKEIRHPLFIYWRKKYNKKQGIQKSKVFSKVKLTGALSQPKNSFRVILANGVQIFIPSDCDELLMNKLLKTLSVIPC